MRHSIQRCGDHACELKDKCIRYRSDFIKSNFRHGVAPSGYHYCNWFLTNGMWQEILNRVSVAAPADEPEETKQAPGDYF